MSTIPVASEILDSVAALMNDVAKQQYTYTTMLPYLKIALKEFRETANLNGLQITNKTSSVITVPAGLTGINFTTTPAFPADLVEIQQIWESDEGTNQFSPMTRMDFIPHSDESGSPTGGSFNIWSWTGDGIVLIARDADRDLKLDYIRTLFQSVADQTSSLEVINADSFLHFRTAALCSRYAAENPTRADLLDMDAGLAMDKILGIESKSKQGITTRRRAFRSSYKSLG